MNWSIKFAYNEMDDLYDNRPWLMVDDNFASGPNESVGNEESFISVQKNLMVQRGWDWFKSAPRGRFFPKLNLTTLTTWNGERGGAEPPIDKIQQKFPGASIVSLIGGPHVLFGNVPDDVLMGIGKIASQQKWKVNTKTAVDMESIKRTLAVAWNLGSAAAAAGVLMWLVSLGMSPQEVEQQALQGASPQDIARQVSPQNVPTRVQPEAPNFAPHPSQVAEIPEIAENNNILPNQLDNTPQENQLDLRNLDGLDSAFTGKVKQILLRLTQKGWQPRVAEGFRSLEQQQKKIDQGYSSLKDPNNSKHVQGLAVDIIDKRYGWNGPASDLDFAFWNDLGEAARAEGLTWGGDWKSFKDVAHVEVSTTKRQQSESKIYHHAYQEMDWFKAKMMVKQLAQTGHQWNAVVKELIASNVPKAWFGRLNGIFTNVVAGAFANNEPEFKRILG